MAEAKKKTAKKTPVKKTAVKKTSPPKKKSSPKKTAKAASKSWGNMSIAQRTAFCKNNRRTIIACIVMAILLAAAGVLKFCVAGYAFSAFLCIGIAAIICFYTIIPKIFKNPKAVVQLFTLLLCILLIAAGFTEALIIRASSGSADTGCAYLLVLGAKVKDGAPSLSLQNRIDAAFQYLTAYPDTIAILSGGQGENESISEAQCMYDHLTQLGISPSRLWMEDKSTSTWENLQYSFALIEDKTGARPKQIAVVSSEYHLYRASLFTKAAGAEFIGIPAATTNPFLKANYFLREVAGVWHYFLLGGSYYA